MLELLVGRKREVKNYNLIFWSIQPPQTPLFKDIGALSYKHMLLLAIWLIMLFLLAGQSLCGLLQQNSNSTDCNKSLQSFSEWSLYFLLKCFYADETGLFQDVFPSTGH